MNPDLEKLKSLQETDGQIQRLTDEITALPKRVAAIQAKLADATSELEKHKVALREGEAARRRLDSEIQSQQQKISKYRDQSLEVKTNEQYRALMHEIEFAERDIRALEDKILQTMLEAESHEKSIRAAQAELTVQTAAVEREKAEAHARTQVDEKELAEWQGKRRTLRDAISAPVLAHYDRVLPVRKTALAEARGQKCSACNVVLRPQKYDEIRGNQQIITCDSCSRILYYDPAHEPPPPELKTRRKKAAETKTSTEAGEYEVPEVPAVP